MTDLVRSEAEFLLVERSAIHVRGEGADGGYSGYAYCALVRDADTGCAEPPDRCLVVTLQTPNELWVRAVVAPYEGKQLDASSLPDRIAEIFHAPPVPLGGTV